jgi:hypothetical protein
MAWVARTREGKEVIFEYKPFRTFYYWSIEPESNFLILPKGSIQKLIGFNLMWFDEPVELK